MSIQGTTSWQSLICGAKDSLNSADQGPVTRTLGDAHRQGGEMIVKLLTRRNTIAIIRRSYIDQQAGDNVLVGNIGKLTQSRMNPPPPSILRAQKSQVHASPQYRSLIRHLEAPL